MTLIQTLLIQAQKKLGASHKLPFLIFPPGRAYDELQITV